MIERKKFPKNSLFRSRTDRFLESRRKKRRNNQELNLLADFLANKISAAGMSHVVRAPSPLRRAMWVVIILVTAAAMSLMTYRVLQEYLEYPTVMKSMSVVVKELEFPAVTMCALSPIPKLFAKEAGLHYMEQMKEVLQSLKKFNTSGENKIRCLKDPLCYWSWFDDQCKCYQNPCSTQYCFPDTDKSDDKCACSMLMCQWNGTAEACKIKYDANGTFWCICTTQFTYPLFNLETKTKCEGNIDQCDKRDYQDLSEDFLSALQNLNTTEEVKNLLKVLKGSRTKDLRDVERFFVPPVGVMDDYGFPIDSFILSCSFGFTDCWDLVTLYTPLYGKCYMFNYVGEELIKEEKVKIVSQAGKTYGLQLFMRSRPKDTLPLLSMQLGVRLIIHDPTAIPLTSEEGVELRPGDMTSITLEYNEITRLGPPWGRCAKNGQKLGDYFKYPYQQNDCERECLNMEVFRRCNCFHPKYIRATTTPHRGNICVTNSTEDASDECFRNTMTDNDAGRIKCDCPPACNQKTYEISMSTSKLNKDFFQMAKTAKSLTIVNGSPAVTQDDFETGLLGVQIYYKSLFKINNEESPIYSWESLIANIGGNMGLFLGLSLVTILEVLEFFADLITKIIVKYRAKTLKVKDETTTY